MQIKNALLQKDVLWRKAFFLLFLTAISLQGMLSAQVDLVNKSSTRQDSAFLFNGVRNNVVLTGLPDLKDVKLVSRRSDISLPYNADGYHVRPRVTGTDTLVVFKKGKRLFTKCFYLIETADPQVAIGAYLSGPLSTGQIIANKALRVAMPGYLHGGCIVIETFQVNFVSNKMEDYNKYWNISGSIIPDQIISLIRKLIPGDKMILENIIASCSSCRSRKLRDVTIVIK
ncbi:MAG: hypothetical protein V4722_14740 [Bacteroidota bacterium]